MKPIIENTIRDIRLLTDQNHLAFSKIMVPTGMETLGVKAPALRLLLKKLNLNTTDFSVREKIDLAIDLLRTNILELGQMAYLYLGENKNLLQSLTKSDLNQLNHQLDNWATVDAFGVYVHGKAWQLGILEFEDIEKLTRHTDFWQRRLAIVSTIPLNRKNTKQQANFESTLRICSLLIDDHHDMIVKALSWALRELGKREPEIVRNYIEIHNNVLHKRIIREVNNKLTFGKKNS